MYCNKLRDAHLGGHLFYVLALLSSSGQALGNWRPYVQGEVFAYSEPNTLAVVAKGWQGEFLGGEQQYLYAWAEAGMRCESWGLGWVKRHDYSLKFSSDTAELVSQVQNNQSLEAGREYDIRLEAYALRAQGVRLFWLPDWHHDLSIEAGVSMLGVTEFLDGTLEGSATAIDSSTYQYSLWVDYSYSQDLLFERHVKQSYGVGLSFDLAAQWSFAPNWRIDFLGRDLLGWVWWDKAPFTKAQALSDRSEVNENGFSEWDPAISGLESYRSIRVLLPPKLKSELYWQPSRLSLGVGGRYQFEDMTGRVGGGYKFGSLQLFSWYGIEHQAVELNIVWRKLQVAVISDNLQLDQAQRVGLSFSFQL